MRFLLPLLLAILSADASQSVTLAWDPNSEANLAGYRLYWGTASRAYSAHQDVAAPEVTSTVAGLSENVTYFFAVTAFTDDALESDFSEEVSYRVPGPPPPAPTFVYSVEKGLVAWPAASGYQDALETTTDFVTWTEIPGPHEARGDYNVFRFGPGTEPQRFFRIRRDNPTTNP